MKTVRQQLIALISEGPMDVLALSQALGLREKEIIAHLPHIVKTIAARGGKVHVREAFCDACGFHFRDRRRLSPPTRCPKCRTSRISGPWFEASGSKSDPGGQ